MAELICKEEVYAMGIELGLRGIPFAALQPVTIYYKRRALTKYYIADFVCYGRILVELKVMERLTKKEAAQLLNCLHATKLQVGLLINFGDPGRLDWERFVL